ncbi:Thioredoxin-like protein 1, partial [Tolypocladium paradoxum]
LRPSSATTPNAFDSPAPSISSLAALTSTPGRNSETMSKAPVVISSKEQFNNILKSSTIVVADFFADWCGPCKAIAPIYETLSASLSRPGAVTFVKINSDNNTDLAEEYSVSSLPTFLLFRDGKVTQKVQGANPSELREVVQKLASEVQSLGESSGGGGGGDGGGLWKGAEIPRGYSDITVQVETRGCELLNADEDAGPVKVLFDGSKPSALNKGKGKDSAKDWVQSGADDQLLLFIPFQSSIKLHTLQLTSLPEDGQDDVSRPEVIHLYTNRAQNLDFSEADDTEPTQAVTLTPTDWNADGTANISLRYVKFQKTTTLIVYVQKGSDGAETVRLDRLRLIGEAGAKREMGKLQKVGEDE